jgi:hypothetical protein
MSEAECSSIRIARGPGTGTDAYTGAGSDAVAGNPSRRSRWLDMTSLTPGTTIRRRAPNRSLFPAAAYERVAPCHAATRKGT